MHEERRHSLRLPGLPAWAAAAAASAAAAAEIAAANTVLRDGLLVVAERLVAVPGLPRLPARAGTEVGVHDHQEHRLRHSRLIAGACTAAPPGPEPWPRARRRALHSGVHVVALRDFAVLSVRHVSRLGRGQVGLPAVLQHAMRMPRMRSWGCTGSPAVPGRGMRTAHAHALRGGLFVLQHWQVAMRWLHEEVSGRHVSSLRLCAFEGHCLRPGRRRATPTAAAATATPARRGLLRQ